MKCVWGIVILLFLACDIQASVQNPYFFSVQKNGKTSYVLGTLHIGISTEDMPKVVLERLQEADAFVSESKLESSASTPISMPVAHEYEEDVTTRLLERGISKKKITYMDPRLLCQQYLFLEGIKSGKYLDQELQEIAIHLEKPRYELDERSLQRQLWKKIFNSCDIRALVRSHSPTQVKEEYQVFQQKYLDGDLKFASPEEEDKELYQIVSRNQDWAAKIEELITKHQSLFINVGFQHLGGDSGLLELLKARGFVVNRVKEMSPLTEEASLVAIRSKANTYCKGVFVAEDVVLTAAHCVMKESEADIAIGDIGDRVYPLNGQADDEPLYVTKIVLAPDKPTTDIWIIREIDDEYYFDNPDLALLKLSQKYKRARPAKLAPLDLPLAKMDFYQFRHNDTFGFSKNPLLQFNRIDLQSFQQLDSLYQDVKDSPEYSFLQKMKVHLAEVEPYFYLAKTETPSLGTLCKGDSGAPLYQMQGNEMYIWGIASFYFSHPLKGRESCNRSYVSAFSKVQPHLNWLQEEIKRLSR